MDTPNPNHEAEHAATCCPDDLREAAHLAGNAFEALKVARRHAEAARRKVTATEDPTDEDIEAVFGPRGLYAVAAIHRDLAARDLERAAAIVARLRALRD